MDKEIVEGNKLIAEFMGGNIRDGYNHPYQYVGFKDENGITNETVRTDNLKYHTSWDWLMPVVEKIEKDFCNEFEMIIYSCSCVINRWHKKSNKYQSYIHEVGNKKEAIYKAVVQFIQWYNQNKTS